MVTTINVCVCGVQMFPMERVQTVQEFMRNGTNVKWFPHYHILTHTLIHLQKQ